MFSRIVATFFSCLLWQAGFALDSDRDQSATLDADDFEIDLKTGVRAYRGNVVFRQGSIRLNCDELVTYLNDDGALDKAVCSGTPGRFKQRPEGSEDDVIGTARTIIMDEIGQEVILKGQVKVVQGGNELSGGLVRYDSVTEKIKVKGRDSASATANKSAADSSPQKSGSATEATETESGRPSLVIQPRKKKKQATGTE